MMLDHVDTRLARYLQEPEGGHVCHAADAGKDVVAFDNSGVLDLCCQRITADTGPSARDRGAVGCLHVVIREIDYPMARAARRHD